MEKDVNYTKYIDTLDKIIKDLEEKKKYNDFILLALKKEYKKAIKEAHAFTFK